VLRSSSNLISGKDITVYKFSDLNILKVTGFVKFLCKRNKSVAQIELYLEDGKALVSNGKYELDTACE